MAFDNPAPVAPLKALFPWFGGKSRAAKIVWDAFGDVGNYVEPFAGSLAVLLSRPTRPHTETINDLDCYVANFYRAVAADPSAVARYADRPVNETDLDARHLWLVKQSEFRELMRNDPDYFDARVAGYWVWGLCAWIGSGFCDVGKYERAEKINRQLPHLGSAGQGINRKLPQGTERAEAFAAQFHALCERLRGVRVACGDWTRVLGPSVTTRHNRPPTGVLLDPPYVEGNMRYTAGHEGISSKVREWAIANGDDPRLRIALCGYEGEHVMPDSWRKVEGNARSGMGGDNGNPARERIWLSRHCLAPKTEFALTTQACDIRLT